MGSLTRLRRALTLGVSLLVLPSAGRSEPSPPFIWYRSSEGCPDGAAFVSRLHGAAEGARLASVADRIDFAVTLGMLDGHASGKLERQTTRGTVAIRQVEATRCDEVADALALTLMLALDPTGRAAPVAPADGPSAPASEPPSNPPPFAPPPSEPPSATVGPAPRAPDTKRSEPGATQPRVPNHWLAGSQLTAYKGSFPELVPGARVFGELQARAPLDATARLALVAAKRVAKTDPGVDALLLGARLEGCPLQAFGPVVYVRPCAALEAGWERFEGTGRFGRSDGSAWLAGAGVLRVGWWLGGRVSLEAEGGVTVPFTRYTLGRAGSGLVVHQTESIGFSAALGSRIRLP